MLKIFIIFLIFALLSAATSPVYNRALFHFSLRTGKMAESFRRVYVSAPIEMKAQYKVILLWNDTDVSNPAPWLDIKLLVFPLHLE